MFPKVAKNACGFAHKQTPSHSAAWLLSLALARGDLAGISHIFARHTHQTREGVPRYSWGVPFCQAFFYLLLT